MDGRQSTLQFTPSGPAMHEQIPAYLTNRQEQVFAGLTTAERKTRAHIQKKAALHAASLDE